MPTSVRTASGAKALAGRYYTSQAVFDRETERVFLDRWLYAGHRSQLPDAGSFLVREVRGESVLVLRDEEGALRAFYNLCRHRGTLLCTAAEGRLGKRLQCPYHAWTYALDGRLVAAPNMQEVAGFDAGDYPLKPIAVGVWEGFVFVNLSPAPQPFAEAFAPLAGKFSRWHLEELETVHREVYEVEANWKLFFQNYNECYHCPPAHPLLNRLSPFRDSVNDLDDGPFLGGPMQLAEAGGSMTMDGRRCAPPLGEVDGDDLGRVYYYTIFPNLFVSLHPDYVLVHRSESLAPGRTRIVCDWLFHPDAVAAPGFDPGPAVEFWHLTNRQDWELCSRAHRGASSRGYEPGPYAELESQLAGFDREYLRALGENPTAARGAPARAGAD